MADKIIRWPLPGTWFIGALKKPLRYFLSPAEQSAGIDRDGKAKYFPKNSSIYQIGLSRNDEMLGLQKLKNQWSVDYFFDKNEVSMYTNINGATRYFRFNPFEHKFYDYWTNSEQSYKEQWEYLNVLKEANNYVVAARKQLDSLVTISKKKMNTAERDAFIVAVATYNNEISAFNFKFKDIIKIELKKVELDIKISGIGLAPVIWILICIGGLAVVETGIVAFRWVQKRAEIAKQKAALDANQKNIDNILQAGKDLAAGKISKETYNKVVDIAQQNTETNNKTIDNQTKNDPSFMQSVQKTVLTAAAAYVIVSLVKK